MPAPAPFDWPQALAFLAARAIDGVEEVAPDRYRRRLRIAGRIGEVTVRAGLEVVIEGDLGPETVTARVRHVFGLDIDLAPIHAHLLRDAVLAPLIRARPGLRPTGGWDGFELAIRAVLGQQITIGSARALGSRLAALASDTGCFPTQAELLAADLDALGMPDARRATLRAVATADPAVFQPGSDLDSAIKRLCAIRGIGPWSAHYIALRAQRQPDAFPASDAALLRCMARLDGTPRTPKALIARAEAWRPFRAFAAQHLWAADAAFLLTPPASSADKPGRAGRG